MRLLDTNILLFLALDRSRIAPKVLEILTEPQARLHVSQVSAIEIAIKSSVGKLPLPAAFQIDFPAAFQGMSERMGATMLGVELPEIARLRTLPLLHRDPFDRLLVAQALEYGLELVTTDRQLEAYPGLKVLMA